MGEYPWDDGVTPHAEDAAVALTYAFAALLSGAVEDAVWATGRTSTGTFSPWDRARHGLGSPTDQPP